VIVNLAMSLNGMIAGRSGKRVNISSDEDWERVHRLRSSVDAIVVGANTIINDNPELEVNEKELGNRKSPARIILDAELRVPNHARIFNSTSRTIIFTHRRSEQPYNAEILQKDKNELRVDNLLKDFWNLGFRKILVEGGKTTVKEFVSSGNVDEFHLYIGDIIIEDGGIELFNTDINISGIIKRITPMKSGVLISLNPYLLREIWKTTARAF